MIQSHLVKTSAKITVIKACLPSLKAVHIRHGFLKKWLILPFLLLFFVNTKVQTRETNYAVHANIIYRFTKYIEWPDAAKTGDFYIGVTGDSPVYNELKKIMNGKMCGGQKIVVKEFSPSASSFECHILFISADESDNIKKIVTRTADIPVLLISESEGLASKGACINFIIESDHLKLEINKKNIKQRKMNIASELLQLGKIVN